MAASTPKLAKIYTEKDFMAWLADTVQQKVAKENAGFVQIENHPRAQGEKPYLVLRNDAISITLDLEQIRRK